MARSTFGGTAADFVFKTTSTGLLKIAGATLTFWDARTGGTQHTVLVDGVEATQITVGADGQVPTFEGPDGVSEMWVDAGAGRVRIVAPGAATWAALPDKPAIPATAADVGADPAGTAQTLVDQLTTGAPGAMDTLNELAAALNDDANFAGTVTQQLAGKADLSRVTPLEDLTTTGRLSAAQLSGTFAPRRTLRPVAPNTHAFARGGSPHNLSDGVSTGITTQLFHTARVAFSGMRLVFANIYNNGGLDTPGPNDITVKANVRMAGGLNFPAYFNGRRSVVVEPGAVVVSDPIGISLDKGATFYTRAYVSVTSGGKYPLGLLTDSAQEGVVAGDFADGSVNVNATRGYGVWGILGTPNAANASPVVLAVGDSITAGYGDVVGTGDAYGWVRRAFDGKLSYVNIGVASASTSGADSIGELANRMRLADVVTHDAAVVLFGTNDLAGGTSAAPLQTRLTNLYAILKARGLKVYGATIPPATTSTDAWATTANQTLGTGNADRLLVNDWIRTRPAPLDGFFEFADAVESARGSGKWKPGHTSDGTHPNATGAAAMAAALDPSVIGPLL